MLSFKIWTLATVLTLALASLAVAQSSRGLSVMNIAVITDDGENLEVVAREPEPGLVFNGSPAWSPDGTKLVFDTVTRDCDWTKNRLFAVDVAGEDKGRLVDLGYGTAPCYSPDGSQIVFTLNPSNPLGVDQGIWVMNSDGGGRERLASGWYARWSPSGDRVAYSHGLGGSVIHLFELRSGRVRPTRVGCEANQRLRWGPDGKRIALKQQRVGTQQMPASAILGVVDLDDVASGLRVLSMGAEDAPVAYEIGMFDWFADGKRFAIRLSSKDHPPGIYAYEIDGSAGLRPIVLDTDTSIYRSPTWSPDGKQLAVAVGEFDAPTGEHGLRPDGAVAR